MSFVAVTFNHDHLHSVNNVKHIQSFNWPDNEIVLLMWRVENKFCHVHVEVISCYVIKIKLETGSIGLADEVIHIHVDHCGQSGNDE